MTGSIFLRGQTMTLFKSVLITITLFYVLIPSTGGISKEKISVLGKERNYYLFVPPSLATEKPIGLLILLHGSGRNGLSLVEKWKEIASKENLILIGPDAQNSREWNIPDDGPEFLYKITEKVKRDFSIDEKRVYLFGHSAGALFALEIGLLESEYFASIYVHAGSLPSDSLTSRAKRKIPIGLIVGDKDRFFSVEQVTKTKDFLKEQGFPVEMIILKNHDHDYYNLSPKINQSAWEFLSKQSLPSPPQYKEYKFN